MRRSEPLRLGDLPALERENIIIDKTLLGPGGSEVLLGTVNDKPVAIKVLRSDTQGFADKIKVRGSTGCTP